MTNRRRIPPGGQFAALARSSGVVDPPPPVVRTRRRVLSGGAVLAAVLVAAGLTTVGQNAAEAVTTGGVPAPYVTTANGSDPHTKPCTFNGQNGICLYTSQDLLEKATPDGNSYPMTQTLGYFSTDGVNWTGATTLLNESDYQTGNHNWVPSGAKHLWAPSAQQGADGNWYLYVPDISDVHDQANSSFVGVSRSTNGPMGPFTVIGKVLAVDSRGNAGYMSDPDVLDTAPGAGAPKLFFADGDGSNCGGISMGDLSSSDMTSMTNVRRLDFIGIPASWGWCTDKYHRAHPYMEGPHVYKPSLLNWPAGSPGMVGSPYVMVVPIKTKAGFVPPECATQVQGQPGSENQIVSWLTADDPAGPWTYRGIIMCGGAKDYTQQGTLIPVTTSAATNGLHPFLYVYHDAPGVDSTGRHRTLHGECLFYSSDGQFAQSIRTGGTQFSDSGAEHDCLLGTADANVMGLKSKATGQFISQNGNNTLTPNRYGIGPWEQFITYEVPGSGPISATVGVGNTFTFNGAGWGSTVSGLATTSSATSSITSTGSGSSATGNQFNLTFSGSKLSMTSLKTGKGVRALPASVSGRVTIPAHLQADATTPEQFTIFHR